ncbi:hypothetical protein T439DRAFT_377138 [Meredithblackwellia eburnea MCA 4105]
MVHPLDPLSAAELKTAVDLITNGLATAFPGQSPYFKALTLDPPVKKILAPWLDDVAAGKRVPTLPRKAEALIMLRNQGKATYYEVFVDLSTSKIDRYFAIPAGHHTGLDEDEMIASEQALLKNEDFKKAIAKLRLPKEAVVVADSWSFGADTRAERPRLIPFMCYARLSSNTSSNHYNYPLPIQPVLDSSDFTLHAINWTPIFGGDNIDGVDALPEGIFPWEKMAPKEYEYDAELRQENGFPLRAGLKPLQVIQPEGASFTVQGRTVSWQKWKLHVGFNFKEGLVISDVRYDNRLIFHRLAVSDMTVPYGDPRSPFHRKQAFDLGDVGAGVCANNLQLGCDCLGEIFYFDWDSVTSKGEVVPRPNVVCLHEQDEGIGWKHTNYRNGKASITRSRVLVLQTIITVANYEYIFAWKFDQAAAMHFEVRATGILSTHLIVPGEKSPYGVEVAPGVFAPNHQHLFSLRIDPAIDGHNNTVVVEDSVTMPYSAASPPKNNQWGVGYTVQKTPVEVSGWVDAAPEKNRVFKILNESKINPVSGRAIGYKLVPTPSQLMLAHPESVCYARAEFGQHHLWVTSHRDEELYAGGKYTNQSSGNVEAVQSWVDRKDNVKNADLVLFSTFGLTHNPRVEDFPVMPCETHQISFKPVDFFSQSPAIDVPPSSQAVNKSKLVDASCCKKEEASGKARL